jgi:hypothetical protein
MKNLFIIVLLFIANNILAQNVSLKKDTIFKGKTVYGMFKKSKAKPVRYFINFIDGNALMDIHCSHLDVKGKPLYVVTFLNDHKQAMITKQPGFPTSFIKEVVKYNLVNNGSSVDPGPETQFINAHPMPIGYADVDQLIEY